MVNLVRTTTLITALSAFPRVVQVTATVQGQADKMQRVFPDSGSAIQALVQGMIDMRVIPAVDRCV